MHHNFFIYSSVDGHLGCFHVLGTVNSAAMNNGIHMSPSLQVDSLLIEPPGKPISYVFAPYTSVAGTVKSQL